MSKRMVSAPAAVTCNQFVFKFLTAALTFNADHDIEAN